MEQKNLIKTIPSWLIAFVVIIALGVLLERIYIAREPIIIFGKLFGPSNNTNDAANNSIKVITNRLDVIDNKINKLEMKYSSLMSNTQQYKPKSETTIKSSDKILNKNMSISNKITRAAGFIFEPTICQRKVDNSLICTISFINLADKEDKILIINGSTDHNRPNSFIYDNLGNQYPVSIQIGSNKAWDNRYIEERFPPNININVDFTAKNVSEDAVYVNILIGLKNNKNSITIKEVPIS